MQSPPVPGSSDRPAAPLDPELLALADPNGEVLMAAEPSFVQRAAVPVDIGLPEPGAG
ncbi:MAG TPA: hypothetical protein VFD94_06175 [Jatrophihabitans sp.]|nr:hypothetical protein [Jatrophihabitans sp.]